MALRIAIALAAILVFTEATSSEMDVTVKYYSGVTLECDSLALNVSENMNTVEKLYWILPDGTLVDSSTTNKLPKNMALSSDGYKLNITDIKDDTFGYYHCIVEYKAGPLKIVRKGININGPDFSELHAQYRHSAMIGGIAAAVMLVIIGGTCIIWHYRYQRKEEESEDLYNGKAGNSDVAYDNSALEMEDVKIEPQDEKTNGYIDEKL